MSDLVPVTNSVDIPEVVFTLPEREIFIVTSYLQGVKVKDIAQQVGISERQIYSILAKPEIKGIVYKTKEVALSELMPIVMDKLEEELFSSNIYTVQHAINCILKLQTDVDKNKLDLEIASKTKFNTLESLMASLDK